MIDQRLAARPELQATKVHYELELRERTVRLEEELRHQRELMLEGFKQMDRRFDEQREETSKRFEQMDKRFEAQREEMNKRFEEQRKETSKGFDEALKRQDRHFFWLLGFIATSSGGLLAAMRFFAGS